MHAGVLVTFTATMTFKTLCTLRLLLLLLRLLVNGTHNVRAAVVVVGRSRS